MYHTSILTYSTLPTIRSISGGIFTHTILNTRLALLVWVLTLLLSCLLATGCITTTAQSHKTDGTFEWLVGTWLRTNDTAQHTTYEIWRQTDYDTYRGWGCTLNMQGDTIFKEEMSITKNAKTWVLTVSGVNEAPTAFEMIVVKDQSFTCQNQQNPFPKNIHYEKHLEQLHASISDDVRKIDFYFVQFHPE